MASNQAAWLTGKQAVPLKVSEAPVPKPAADEIIIDNKAVAINPVDWKIQYGGFYIENFPNILGEDAAGEVIEVGSDVKNFKKGDRVIAHCFSLMSGSKAHAGFQSLVAVPERCSSVIPSGTSFTDAVVLPLAISTAAAGLYQKTYLELPHPVVSSGAPQPSNKTIVVWGGSSSVGTVAIQLARASGVEVITTASKHNHDYCQSLGASKVFDHSSPSVVEDIVKAIKDSGKHLAGIYDSISYESSIKACSSILEQAGGDKKLALVLPGSESHASKGIDAKAVFAITVFTEHKEVGQAVWGKFVPEALKSGALKPLPEALVIGKGLESVQAGMDKNKEGVSAKKVVVDLA